MMRLANDGLGLVIKLACGQSERQFVTPRPYHRQKCTDERADRRFRRLVLGHGLGCAAAPGWHLFLD